MERKIKSYGGYFNSFLKSLNDMEKKKVGYALLMLKTQDILSTKWVKHIGDGIFELRVELNSNIFRIFFIFDENQEVILFNGFKKKTQKTPREEIEKVKKIRTLYYEEKRQNIGNE